MCSAYSQTVYQRVWWHPSKNFLAEKKKAPKPTIKLKIKAIKCLHFRNNWLSPLLRWIILFSKVWVKGEVDDPRLTVVKI